MLRYDIIPEGNIITAEGSGKIGAEELLAFFAALVQDKEFKPDSRIFFDASRIESESTLTIPVIRQHDSFLAVANACSNVRLAVFAPEDHQFGLAQAWVKELGGLTIHARIFSDLSIAQLWLGVPVFVM